MSGDQQALPPTGIDGSGLSGPHPVGEYAQALRERLRKFTRVQVFGEVSGLGVRAKAVYFELRDANGALPCSMWRSDFDRLNVRLENGMQVVLAGGCDYYTGSATSSPSFSFRATGLKVAGEGELLAQIERLRRKLHAEGLFEPQGLLPRPALPQSIGVVTGQAGKARDDVLAGLRRRGWAGRVVWGFAPVQDRRAAPAISMALRDLVAVGDVDVIVVARGGGSVMDLMAFSDEALCRTVALLPVPVIASVGHHTDRTLIDDVAAVSCSTPTHAAETAVRLDCREARAAAAAAGVRLEQLGRRAVVERARRLSEFTRAPAAALHRHRARAHQQLREMRASGRRRLAEEIHVSDRRLLVLRRKADTATAALHRERDPAVARSRELGRAGPAALARRAKELEALRVALAAHDPSRVLERGYALVETPAGELVTSARAARAAADVSLRFHDDSVTARVEDR